MLANQAQPSYVIDKYKCLLLLLVTVLVFRYFIAF